MQTVKEANYEFPSTCLFLRLNDVHMIFLNPYHSVMLPAFKITCLQNVGSYSFECLDLLYHRSVAKMFSVFVMRRLHLNYISGQVKFKSLKC